MFGAKVSEAFIDAILTEFAIPWTFSWNWLDGTDGLAWPTMRRFRGSLAAAVRCRMCNSARLFADCSLSLDYDLSLIGTGYL